jgi:pyruvate,water dikinase
MINRYPKNKRALLAKAERLVQAKVLGEREDHFFLTLEELHDVVRTEHVNGSQSAEAGG